MKSLRERSKALAEALWNEAQPLRMYDIIEEHFKALLEDEAKDMTGAEE